MDKNLDINIHFCERPWGHYIKLFEEAGVWVKRVEVNPGGRLSLQTHAHRSEKWNIVSGKGLVLLNGKEIPVSAGAVVDVPCGAAHRIGNIGSTPLILIEVAVVANGGTLSEDDITRIEDDYHREEHNDAT